MGPDIPPSPPILLEEVDRFILGLVAPLFANIVVAVKVETPLMVEVNRANLGSIPFFPLQRPQSKGALSMVCMYFTFLCSWCLF